LPGFPASRVIVLAVLLFGLTWLAAWPVAHAGVGDWPAERAASFQRKATMAMAAVSVLAYLAALCAVERDRRGGGRNWVAWRRQIRRVLEALPRRQKPFRSPRAAQRWFEWRRGGWLLPFTVGFFLALILGPIAWLVKGLNAESSFVIDPESTVAMLCVVLALPFVLAFFVGKRQAEKELTSTPFHFLRPVTQGGLLLGKLETAGWSAALAWLLVLVVTPLWLALWCDPSLLVREWRTLQAVFSPATLWALLPLALVSAVGLTWRWMVVSLYLGLWGRPKIFISSVGLTVVGAWLLLVWLGSQAGHLSRPWRWAELLPWLGVGLALKGLVAAWAFRAAHRRALLSARALWIYLAVWLGMTGCLAALAGLLFSPTSVPGAVIVCGAALVFPLARIGLATLALEAQRHR